MAMRVVYTVVNGEILSENRGGVKRDYLPDPSGNTIALLDNTQTKTDTWVYWPFGEVKTHVGSSTTPFQAWGVWGYYTDTSGRLYVRARYLDVVKGRWLTSDPIGFEGGSWNLYEYASSNPATITDPSGLQTRNTKKCWDMITTCYDYSYCEIKKGSEPTRGNKCFNHFGGCCAYVYGIYPMVKKKGSPVPAACPTSCILVMPVTREIKVNSICDQKSGRCLPVGPPGPIV